MKIFINYPRLARVNKKCTGCPHNNSTEITPKWGTFDIGTPSTPFGVLNGVLNWKYYRKSSPPQVIHLKVNLGQLMKIFIFLSGLSGGQG